MDNQNKSFEPMDVDTSLTSKMSISLDSDKESNHEPLKEDKLDDVGFDLRKVKEEKLSDDDSTPIRNPIGNSLPKSVRKPARKPVKKFNIKMKPKDKRTTLQKLFYSFKLLGFIVLILSVLIYHLLSYNCAEKLNLAAVYKNLNENVFGQNEALNLIVKALNSTGDSKVLFLYGGTGIGKTFTTSLILENIRPSINVYHYTSTAFGGTLMSEYMIGLHVCKFAIVVVDDLIQKDIYSMKDHVKDILAKSVKLKKEITIILIFNCDSVSEGFVKKCEMSFGQELKNAFSDINVSKHYIMFDQLTEIDLKKCIEREIDGRRVNNFEMNNFMKNFNVEIDGCKSVHAKVKSLNLS